VSSREGKSFKCHIRNHILQVVSYKEFSHNDVHDRDGVMMQNSDEEWENHEYPKQAEESAAMVTIEFV
jgi:hypothetical protein